MGSKSESESALTLSTSEPTPLSQPRTAVRAPCTLMVSTPSPRAERGSRCVRSTPPRSPTVDHIIGAMALSEVK